MTTASEPRGGGRRLADGGVVYDEPPIKLPPSLSVGPIAWVRDNLFRTWLDTLLTIVSSIIVIGGTISLVQWATTQANWMIINFNLRQYMLGRYTPEAEWRVQAALLLIALIAGVALAAWGRISRVITLIVIVALALMFIIPALTDTLPLPPAYFTAGQTEIVSGSSTQLPQPELGFIGQAGETIEIRLAENRMDSDEALAQLASFGDVGANLLRAAAVNRLASSARLTEIEALLAEDAAAGPTLTANQREQLTTERDRIDLGVPVTEVYALNQEAVSVRVVRGTTRDVLAEATLEAGDEPLTLTLPDDGWYILEKSVSGDGAALLETHGIYPLMERSFTRSEELDEAGEMISQAGRVSQYARMTDGFTTEELRPRIDGTNVPMNVIIDNQYRGDRTFKDYLRLFLGPFLAQTNTGLLLVAVFAAVGYAAGRGIDRLFPRPRQPRYMSRRAASWLLIAGPVVAFLLIYGVGDILPITDTRRWGGLLLTMMLTAVGIVASFPLGVLLALGRRSELPVVRTASIVYIEFVRGVPLITVLYMAQLLVPLVNPSLAEVDNVFRAMVGIILFSAAYLAENVRGGLQSIPPGQEEAAKAIGLSSVQITLHILLPQALRAVIPALVGQFISLFKDTSLVAIVGLIDLTGISQSVTAQTEFLGLRRESYLFITIIYFVFSYWMAHVSRRLESTGSGAARRV
jgi:His/Glu/Gln/Arg/opine family amino acid ABC transporter permease subunit